MSINTDIINANEQLLRFKQDVPAETENEYQTGLGETVGGGFLFGAPLMLGQLALSKTKPASVWQYRNKNLQTDGSKLGWSEAWKKYGESQKAEKQTLSYLEDSDSWWKTRKNKSMFSNLKGIEAELPTYDKNVDITKLQGKDLVKYQNASRESSYYREVRKLIKEAKDKKLTGQALKDQLKKIHEAMAKADSRVNLAIQKGRIKPTGKLGKASHWIKSKTGVYKVKSSLLKNIRGAKALRMAKVGMKGTWLFAAIEGACEISDVASSYKQSRADGNRQLAKSATKVAASVGGYALGSAAAGAIAGSVVPGIGTVAGAVVGLVGGLIGGWLAGKGAEKVTQKVLGESESLGKTETDFAKEKELKAQAEKATENIDEQRTLLAEVEAKAEECGGFDDQATLDAYEKILNERAAELGESDTEGAGSIDAETTQSAIQQTTQYDEATQKLLYGLSGIASLNQVA